MIKFFSLKQQQQQQQQQQAAPANAAADDGSTTPATEASPGAGTATTRKKPKAAHLRVQKDLSELSLPKGVKIDFPSADDLLNFKLTILPDEGLYRGGSFDFTFKIKDNYPHEPPKVRCLNKIYHPNIDLDGGVCLNILRDDWMPVLSIQSVVYGLQYLFLEPNPDDPLNKEAAEVLRSNRRQFEDNVRRTMRGGVLGGVDYDNVLVR